MAGANNQSAWLYFHSPCFDGIVSCVIASDFLERYGGWRFERFYAIDYAMRANWLSQTLHSCSAIVDFLYHPQAAFWADHHSTTFVTQAAKRDFDARQNKSWMFYDSQHGSWAA